jgi:hypothetical protein
MVTERQIEEWIEEINERPASAGGILRAIAARLRELERWNEELLTDNITLREGSKVEDYEARIAALEYQLELLKRHTGEGASLAPAQSLLLPGAAKGPTWSLFLYNPAGQVLRLALPPAVPPDGQTIARMESPPDPSTPPGLLAARDDEELLFVFDSGRSLAMPAAQIGMAADWKQSQRILPRPGEELAAVLPIAGLPLAESCVQVSRRACAKLMPKASFQAAIARGAVGAGVKRKPDKTALLALCAKEDALVVVTCEGWLTVLPAARLPFSVEEIMQLSASDHVVAGFAYTGQGDLLFITRQGKAVRRDAGWLEPPGSYKSRGQPVFSTARREGGVRLAGAAVVRPGDSCAALSADGSIRLFPAAVVLEIGTVPAEGETIAICIFPTLA